MKVLIVIHYFPPHVGGMEIVAQTQAKLLAAAGHDVTVLTSAAPSPAGISEAHGYKVVRVNVWNYFERAMGVPFPFFSPILFWKMAQLVRTHDVVHVHDAFYLTSLAAALWCKILQKPLLLTQHVDLIPHPKKIVTLVQKLIYKTTGKFVFQVSRKIMVLNSNVASFLRQNGVAAKKIVFVPNGVDLKVFNTEYTVHHDEIRKKYHLPVDKPIALFVGRFVPKKGFDKLLQAGSDEYHIALAGGNAPKSFTDTEHFTFLGSLKPAQLAEVYKAVDIFILPSQGEGFPLTVQEAMASGLPVIISDHPGYDLYHLDKSLISLIQPEVAVIQRTLQVLVADGGLRQEMAKYSSSYAQKHFNWETNIATVQELYHEVRR